mmetsp:Transcript_38280/g.108218  ORF Transcript_38280/g.108218 Transcript_38280/m.108218 type:complete len:324 (+) Transcript_38280:207-1178(+)
MQQHNVLGLGPSSAFGDIALQAWCYDSTGQRSPALEVQWEGVETDWEWGYPEQQQQVAGLMAALLPSDKKDSGSARDTDFQEVASRRRRKDHDPSDSGYSSAHSAIAIAMCIEELQTLSPFATKVPDVVLQRLQQLSEEGCNLAAMLDERAWSALAALSVDDGLQVIGQVAGQLIKTPQQIRNVNAVLMSHAGKHLRDHARLAGAPPVPQQPVKVATPKKSGVARPAPPNPARRDIGNLGTLSPEVQQKARELMQQFGPYLSATHFDNGIVSVLKQMGDANAQLALEAVKASCSGRGARDWSKLSNPSAYIMSIISPYIRRSR